MINAQGPPPLISSEGTMV